MVRQAAADWAGAWRSEFSPARIVGLIVLGVVAAVGSTVTLKTPILLAVLPVAMLAAVFIGVAAVMTNLDRVSRASASVVEARDDGMGSGPQSM